MSSFEFEMVDSTFVPFVNLLRRISLTIVFEMFLSEPMYFDGLCLNKVIERADHRD